MFGNVVKTLQHQPDEMADYYVRINNLRVTPNHELYMNGDWLCADEINVGDIVSKNNILIFSKEIIYERVTTYDLVVQPLNILHQQAISSETVAYYADGYLTYKGSDYYHFIQV